MSTENTDPYDKGKEYLREIIEKIYSKLEELNDGYPLATISSDRETGIINITRQGEFLENELKQIKIAMGLEGDLISISKDQCVEFIGEKTIKFPNYEKKIDTKYKSSKANYGLNYLAIQYFLYQIAYEAKIQKIQDDSIIEYFNERLEEISGDREIKNKSDGNIQSETEELQVSTNIEISNKQEDVIKESNLAASVLTLDVKQIIEKVKKERGYKDHEIHNLLICLTHGFINVLSGPPGCGKTSICNIMAASMGLSAEKNTYVPISVGRNWNDTGDLLGYYNPFSDSMNGTPLYTALTENNKSNKAPLMVLLDESNLSSMEYYWSDFMGMCDDKKGSISIKGSDTKVEIHENVRFIATINNDETTERLSPRLIDRSWVITPPDNTSTEEIWTMDSLESEAIELSESVVTMEDLKEFYQPQDSTEDTGYTEVIKGCFEYPNDTQDNEDGGKQTAVQISVTDILKDLGIELSVRSRQAIIQYVAAAMSIVDGDNRIMSDKLIMDYVLMQKILPKMNGYGDGYRTSIENLKVVLNDYFKDANKEVKETYRTVDYLDKVLKKGETTKYYTFFM